MRNTISYILENRRLLYFVVVLLVMSWAGSYFIAESTGSSELVSFFCIFTSAITTIMYVLISGESFKKIGLDSTKFRSTGFHIPLLVILLIIAVNIMVTLIVNIMMFNALNNQDLLNELIMAIFSIPSIFIFTIMSAFLEELSWSGWLYVNLAELPYINKNLVISLIWVMWHVPMWIWGVMIEPLTFPVFITSVVLLIITRFLYSWYRERSDEIFWPTIAHGTVNTSGFVALSLIGIFPGIALLLDVIGIVSLTIILVVQYFVFDKKK